MGDPIVIWCTFTYAITLTWWIILLHQSAIRNKFKVKLVILDYFFSIIVLVILTLTVLPSTPLELICMCKI